MSNIKPASAVVAAAAVPTSLTIEQRIANAETDIKTLFSKAETDVESDFAKAKAWVIANWPHFVTWIGGVYLAYKHLA